MELDILPARRNGSNGSGSASNGGIGGAAAIAAEPLVFALPVGYII